MKLALMTLPDLSTAVDIPRTRDVLFAAAGVIYPFAAQHSRFIFFRISYNRHPDGSHWSNSQRNSFQSILQRKMVNNVQTSCRWIRRWIISSLAPLLEKIQVRKWSLKYLKRFWEVARLLGHNASSRARTDRRLWNPVDGLNSFTGVIHEQINVHFGAGIYGS